MAQLLVEVNADCRVHLEELTESIGKDARIVNTKNLDGSEIAKLIIENFPSYTSLIITLVQLFKKKGADLTLRKEGGEKIVNPTDGKTQEFLTSKDESDLPK